MRIRFEYTQYPHWGGRSGYVQLVRHLDPRRFQIDLHGTPDSEETGEFAQWLMPFRPSLRRWIKRGGRMPWYKLGDLCAEIAALESCSARGFDIIHFLDGEHSAQFLPRVIKASGLSDVRTVATFHQPPEWAQKVVDGTLLRWLDAIVLVSPSQLPFFSSFVPEDRLHLLLHGIDTDFFRPASSPPRLHRVRCITTGHWLRDWDTFRKVASVLGDISFDVVTRRDIKFEDLPNVNVHSGVSDAELAELYRSADILFLPLVQSTANNALLEGIASGLPVIATDLEAVRAYLPNSEGLLVVENSVDGAIGAIRRLGQDFQLRHEMGQRSRARAEELAWPNIIRQYELFYESLLRRAPSKGEIKPAVPRKVGSGAGHPEKMGPYLPLHLAVARAVDSDSMECRGYTLLQQGLYDRAKALFEALVTAHPRDHRGYAGLALTAEGQWNWSVAIKQWDKCRELATSENSIQAIARKAHCLVEMGKIDAARGLFQSIGDRFDGLEGLAHLLTLEGSFELASTRWEECTKQFPDQIGGFLGMAALFIDHGEYIEAEKLLSHVVAVWPDSKDAAVLWARCATDARELETADARWRNVLNRHASQLDVHAEYARHVAISNDPPPVITHLVQHPVRLAEMLLQYHLARDDYEAAIEEARKLVEWEAQKLAPRLRLATLLMWCGSKEAQKDSLLIFQDLLRQSPESVLIKTHLIEACIRSDLESEARDLLSSIPAEDKRVGVEILRAWARHCENTDPAGCHCWQTIFFDFRIIQESNNLQLSHLMSRYPTGFNSSMIGAVSDQFAARAPVSLHPT